MRSPIGVGSPQCRAQFPPLNPATILDETLEGIRSRPNAHS
jgi:hypothetical protein